MLRTVVLALLIWMAVMVVAITALIAVAASRLRDRNRVVPGVATLAPLHWLWSPTQAARLHRQLRDVATALHPPADTGRRRARTSAPPVAPTVELRRSLCLEATRLDAHLATTRRAARPVRRATTRVVAGEMSQLDQLAQRIRMLEAHTASLGGYQQSSTIGLGPIAQQLDLLEAAHGELDAIERAAGLGPVAALPTDTGGHLPQLGGQRTPAATRRTG